MNSQPEALRGSDPALLLDNASPGHRLSGAEAIDALLRRTDLPELLARTSESWDHAYPETARDLISEGPIALPLVLPGLLAWLAQTTSRPGAMLDERRLHALIAFLAKQKPAAAQIIPVLEAMKARLDRRAFKSSRKLTQAIRTLKGEPPVPISGPWQKLPDAARFPPLSAYCLASGKWSASSRMDAPTNSAPASGKGL